MRDETRLEVENLRELQQALRKVKDTELPKALRAANKNMAQLVAEEALPHVPVGRTGRLKASVKAVGGARDAKVKAGTAARVPYAAAIHWGRLRGNVGSPPGNRRGTNMVKGRPFLWEAKERVLQSGRGVAEYEAELKRILDVLRTR